MDLANYDAQLVRAVADAGVLADEPFVLVDVGCSGEVDALWRLFRDDLRAYGFDPKLDEIDRLRREETNPGVTYHAAFMGLPDDHSIVRHRGGRPADADLGDAMDLTSTAAAVHRDTAQPRYDWRSGGLADERVGLSEFLRRASVERVDFVKVDTDGSDLDVLLSFEESIEATGVLGFMLEAPFVGSDAESSSTFHNIDRLLRRHGFELIALDVARYSRAALPAPFTYRMFAQTRWGQPLWGDVVYVREPAPGASVPAVLKAACLYELFCVPDRAVELLLAQRHRVGSVLDVDASLDLLTPPLDGERVGYRDYIAAFEADPERFFPEPRPPEPEAPRRRRFRR